VTSRTEPLRAAQHTPAPPVAPPVPADWPASVITAAPPPTTDAGRFQQLADGIRGLRIGSSRKLGERTLMIAGSAAVGVGLLLVMLGWWGAAHTPNLYEQIPYVASGGFLGLGLIFLGAFFYFAHWLTELVKEGRAQSASVVEAIARLEETVRQQAGLDRYVGATNGSTARPPVAAAYDDDEEEAVLESYAPLTEGESESERELVATTRGSMAHRIDCVVVGGKPGLRRVTTTDDLQPCKLCDPYGDD
jgi:hypothetical protein